MAGMSLVFFGKIITVEKVTYKIQLIQSLKLRHNSLRHAFAERALVHIQENSIKTWWGEFDEPNWNSPKTVTLRKQYRLVWFFSRWCSWLLLFDDVYRTPLKADDDEIVLLHSLTTEDLERTKYVFWQISCRRLWKPVFRFFQNLVCCSHSVV